jgi:hypothetical protein
MNSRGLEVIFYEIKHIEDVHLLKSLPCRFRTTMIDSYLVLQFSRNFRLELIEHRVAR